MLDAIRPVTLRPGGSLYFAEGHPTACVFDDATRSADGMPGLGRQRVIEVRMNKTRALGETEFAGQLTRRFGGGGREIEADHLRTTLRQCQAVGPEMACR
jgi:hypothetical protein